jgi:recombination protein RecR
MKIARPLQDVIDSFSKLPGVGPKSAQRLAYYLLHVPQSQLDAFAESLSELKRSTVLCSVCRDVSEHDPCGICSDDARESDSILVVEHPLEVLAFERSGKHKGTYHVLHGSINPLDNIGPDEIYVEDLFRRVREANGNPINEIIIATNPTMEGEATAMYISQKLAEIGKSVKVTRLGMGIPTGAALEYADELTLSQALEGRRAL